MKWILLTFGLVLALAGYIALEPENNLTSTVLNSPKEAKEESEVEVLGITLSPTLIRQGDPAIITITGLGTSTVSSLTFDNRFVRVFEYKGKPTALIGFDLRMKTGTYPLVAVLSDGRKIREKLVVTPREIEQATFGIPDKLGGNTPEAEKALINTLVQEAAIISAIPTTQRRLWDGHFRLPLDSPIVVTDTYGYSRLTGASTFSHKGTDYRAEIGTPVYAMNSGIVRFTSNLRNYGNTIVIDHGLGLMTIYMHLSEIGVNLGQEVSRGQTIGKSGDTGYVLGPHLHLTVRIYGVSIDPEKFMELFK